MIYGIKIVKTQTQHLLRDAERRVAAWRRFAYRWRGRHSGKKGTVKHAKFTAAEVVPLAATAAGSRHYWPASVATVLCDVGHNGPTLEKCGGL